MEVGCDPGSFGLLGEDDGVAAFGLLRASEPVGAAGDRGDLPGRGTGDVGERALVVAVDRAGQSASGAVTERRSQRTVAAMTSTESTATAIPMMARNCCRSA